MSHENILSESLSSHELDRTVAKLGVVASVLLLTLQLFASQVFLLAIPLSTGIASLGYLALRSGHRTSVSLPALSGRAGGYLPAVVYSGLALLVVATQVAGGRPPEVYLLTGAIGTVIIGQILLLDDAQLRPGSILAQIVVAAVVIRLSALLVTPGFVGVDIWTHVPQYIGGIVRAESLSAIAGTKYSMAPLYHAYGAVATLVVGDPRTAVYFSLGIVLPLSLVFVYATGSLFIPVRWALLGTALYAFADQVIRWGMHIIPTSLGLVFFLVVLYLVTRLLFADADRWIALGLLVFSLAIVFTHQVSTAILLVFLGVAAFVAILVQLVGGANSTAGSARSAGILGGVFVVNLVVSYLSWSMTPWSRDSIFLDRMVFLAQQRIQSEAGFLNLQSSSGGSSSVAQTAPQSALAPVLPYVDVIGFSLLLTIAVIGGLRMLRWHRQADLSLLYIFSAGAMFVGVFGLSLFGITVFLPGRWLAFLYVPLAIMGALGVYGVVQYGSSRSVMITVLVLALVFPTSMVVAEKASLDDPVFDDYYPRFSYTTPEIAAVDTIHEAHAPGEIRTDHPYQTLFKSRLGYERGADTLALDESGSVATAPVVYRTYQTTGPVTFDPPDDSDADVYRSVAPAAICRPQHDRVYSNDEVQFCTPNTVTEGST